MLGKGLAWYPCAFGDFADMNFVQSYLYTVICKCLCIYVYIVCFLLLHDFLQYLPRNFNVGRAPEECAANFGQAWVDVPVLGEDFVIEPNITCSHTPASPTKGQIRLHEGSSGCPEFIRGLHGWSSIGLYNCNAGFPVTKSPRHHPVCDHGARCSTTFF